MKTQVLLRVVYASMAAPATIALAIQPQSGVEKVNITEAGSRDGAGDDALWSPPPDVLTPVEFNQHFIERAWLRNGGERARAFVPDDDSASTAGIVRNDADGHAAGVDADFDDPLSVAAYVLTHTPAQAIVYPTEQYYYFRFHLNDRCVNGNFRFTDADKGVLHLGYFDAYNIREVRTIGLGEDNGWTVRPLPSSGGYEVRHGGLSVEFTLSATPLRLAGSVRTVEGERIVTGVLDESGIAFVLLYDEPLKSLYYVLNEAMPAADRFAPVGEDGRFLVGQESRYVLYHDPEHGRKVLVGVLADNVRRNNYYDGPFDQVPPRLRLRDVLEAAYPYVKERGGIDEHGNFLEQPGMRVAVSPYQTYEDLHGLVETLSAIAAEPPGPGPAAWAAMTYESKRDYHLRLAKAREAREQSEHGVPVWVAQGWPANHRSVVSRSWPSDHAAALSRTWPANHSASISAEQAGAPRTPPPRP